MSERIKIREVIEYEIEVEDYEKDSPEDWADYCNALGDVVSVQREVLSRKHLVDYVLDVDTEREVWILRADGVNVFESRSHDARDNELFRRRGQKREDMPGGPYGYRECGDVDDPDKTWSTIKERNVNE